MTFTPGPWKIEVVAGFSQSDELHTGVFVAAGEYRTLATLIPVPEVAANARLMAAAPDLYAACKAIAAFHAQVFVGHPMAINGVPIDHTTLNEASALAQRAIAKADGR